MTGIINYQHAQTVLALVPATSNHLVITPTTKNLETFPHSAAISFTKDSAISPLLPTSDTPYRLLEIPPRLHQITFGSRRSRLATKRPPNLQHVYTLSHPLAFAATIPDGKIPSSTQDELFTPIAMLRTQKTPPPSPVDTSTRSSYRGVKSSEASPYPQCTASRILPRF